MRSEPIEKRFPDNFWPGGLAGMVGQPQAGPRRLGIERTVRLGGDAALIPAQPDADDRRKLAPHGRSFAEDPLALFQAEVADGVEDPVEG